MQEALKISNLSFKYPKADKYALSDVSLSINQGDFVVITGPGGAGKTTLCLAMCGLIPHMIPGTLDGNVEVLGKNTRNVEPHEIASNMGIVFQEPDTQFFTSSVENDLAFPLENLNVPREEIRARVDEVLKTLRLERYRIATPYKLSGGEKQRVAVAIGLVLRPKIMIYDEVTSSLDPLGKIEVTETIRRLHEQYGITSILVTHDIEETITRCNRLIVLEKGQIVLDGPPKDVIRRGLDYGLGIKFPTISELGYCLMKRGYEIDVPIEIDEARTCIDVVCEKTKLRKAKKEHVLEELKREVDEQTPIIDAKDVYFSYTNKENNLAAKEVNLKIFPEEMIAIIGQNGSGKTTLMKQFAGLLKPTKGEILINGQDAKKTPIRELCRVVGYLYQYPEDQLFSSTVAEEIAFGPKNLGLPKDKIETIVKEVSEKLGISDLLGTHPFFLSRPEKRVVTLASVLSMDPKILILDEPTTGQDWAGSKRILDIVKKLNAEGKTVLFVTHDIRLVCEYAKRVVVMSAGKIIADGPVREIFANQEVLKEAFIENTQLTRLFQDIYDETVLTVEEAEKLVEKFLKNKG
jgi:energy-coupling factor transport system ATP-binding protein